MVLLPLRRPAPPRLPPDPDPLEPRRKELEGTPAGPAPFAVEPFLQAVEVLAEQEGTEALGSLQWSLLGRPRLRGLLEGAASRGSDGFQSLLRERFPAVVPGDAEGYLLAIRAHLRALLQEGEDTAVEPTGAEPAPSARAMSQRKPLAGAEPGAGGGALAPAAAPPALGAGEPLAGAQRRRLESAFADSFPEVRLHHGSEAARLSRALGARAFTYGSDVVFGAHQYAPGTPSGDALLAHELAHVLQQRGAGPSGLQAQGAGLEHQADQAAADVMARLWGREIFGTVDLPAPQPLSRSGLALSGCSRRRREVPTGTGVHLDVGDVSNGITMTPPTAGLAAALPDLTVNETADRQQVLANLASSGVGSVYIFFGHGALPTGGTAAVGVNPERGSTVMGPDIEAGLAAGDPRTGLNPCTPPTLVILGGCASQSLLPGVNAAGTPVAMGFTQALSGTLASNAVRIFMERLQAGDTFAQARQAADIAAQQRVNPFEPSLTGVNASEAGFHLVVVRFRDDNYNGGMTLADAQARHRSEATGCP
jgi:hypothetical protein